MIVTELYEGQGLGNQLWAYVVTRLIAHHHGCDFAILSPERFKGKAFIDLDFGKEMEGTGEIPNNGLPEGITNYYQEKKELRGGHDISGEDKDLFAVPVNTKIDGNFQSYSYIKGNEELVKSWLHVEHPFATNDNTCVIHVRMGDYLTIPDVFLPKEYYDKAMDKVKELNPAVKFVIVSDQKNEAKQFLQLDTIGSNQQDRYKAPHHFGGDISVDFSYLMNAKYLIIPNSSFGWWAAFLNEKTEIIVAPEYWAKRSMGFWSTGDIKTDGFIYV